MADRSAARISQSSAECIRVPVSEPARMNPSPTPPTRSKMRRRKLSQFAGDAVAALRITLIPDAFLEAEIDRLSAAVSSAWQG
jgi:hypothetical protein